jgi:hypothetical protein
VNVRTAPRKIALLLSSSFLLLALLPVAPVASADPLTDAEKWTSCYPWIVEQTAQTFDAYYQYVSEDTHAVKCKLKLMPVGIHITSDADLTVMSAGGVLVTNKANGVIGGSGTYNDPFLILGHEWNGLVPTACPALTISGTNAYIVVANNWFHDMSCGPALIVSSDHVIVDGNRFSSNTESLAAHGPTPGARIEIRNNRFEDTYSTQLPVGGGVRGQAIYVNNWHANPGYYSWGAYIHDNTIVNGGGYRTIEAQQTIATVEHNTISSSAPTGIFYMDAEGYSDAYQNTITMQPTGSMIPEAVSMTSFDGAPGGSYQISRNQIHGGVVIAGIGAGTLTVYLNSFYAVTGPVIGSPLDVEALCNSSGSCATANINQNHFYELSPWTSAMYVTGRGSITNNWFDHPYDGQSPVSIEVATNGFGGSQFYTITGNQFSYSNPDIQCDSPGLMSQSSNTGADGAVQVSGC